MTRSTKLLLIGLTAALVIAGVGVAGVYHVEGELTRLRALCEQEDRNMQDRPTPGFRLECDPTQLDMSDRKERERYERAVGTETVVQYKPLPGTQAQLVAAQRRLEAWRSKPFLLAGVMTTLSALPWFWYFLLDRIREFSNAVRG